MLPAGVELNAEDLKSQANNTLYRGFSGLAGLAGAIRDPAGQAQLIAGALEYFTKSTEESSNRSRLNATDFEIFNRQLQALNLTGENAAKVEHALAAAREAVPKPQQ